MNVGPVVRGLLQRASATPVQTARAAHYLDALAPADRGVFERLVEQAPSDLHRGFLWKGLAAAHTVPELEAFAKEIHAVPEADLLNHLRLRDAAQMHGLSCEVTEWQAALAESDPLYALRIRTLNPDVHQITAGNPYATNWQFAHEQAAWLERYGGAGGTRIGTQGSPIWGDRAPALWEELTERTGIHHGDMVPVASGSFGVTPTAVLDALEAQLRNVGPTPIRVSGDGGSHATLLLEVEGTAGERVFHIHDPWTGEVVPVTEQQLMHREIPLKHWSQLEGYRRLTPASPAEPFELQVLPELQHLPPPAPPPRTVEAQKVTETVKPVRELDADGRFVRWLYPQVDYDWRGVVVVGSRRYVDLEGNVVKPTGTLQQWPLTGRTKVFP